MEYESQIFRSSKLKVLLFFLISLVFVWVSCYVLDKDKITTWFCIFFFGLLAFVLLVELGTNSSFLKIDKEGLEIKSIFYNKKYLWSNIKNIRIVNYRGIKSVWFDYIDAKNEKRNGLLNFLTASRVVNASTYNIKTEEFYNLMKKYWQKNKKIRN